MAHLASDRHCYRARGDSLSDVLGNGLFFVLPTFIDATGSIFMLASHFGLGIICIVLITGVAYISIIHATKSNDATMCAEALDRRDSKAVIKNESLTNVELLKYFCMEPYGVMRYSKSLLRTQKASWDWDIYRLTIDLLRDTVQVSGELRIRHFELLLTFTSGVVAGSLLIAHQIIAEDLDIGLFVMFLTYINSILASCECHLVSPLP